MGVQGEVCGEAAGRVKVSGLLRVLHDERPRPGINRERDGRTCIQSGG
jgi:hypothetical protein